MGRQFEGFQIFCTDYDYILGKRGDSIQGRKLYKEGHYSRKYVRYCKVELILLTIAVVLYLQVSQITYLHTNV